VNLAQVTWSSISRKGTPVVSPLTLKPQADPTRIAHFH
jgi:hypothetical protein